MRTHRLLIGRITVGLLLILVAAGCSRFGPQLYVDVDNSDGPKRVTVTVDSSGTGRSDDEAVVIHQREGAAWHVPLGSTWEVKIDGRHIIGSDDQAGALPSPGQQQDVTVSVRVDADGTVRLLNGP